MIEDNDRDGTLLNSALQSGRKLVVSDAGKLVLNNFKVLAAAGPTSTVSTPTRPAPVTTSSVPRPSLAKFATNGIPSNAIRFEQLRKKTVFMPAKPAAANLANGMPLKTNKVIKILSAEEFKQMCGANAGNNTLKRISTESLHNGSLK